MTREIERWKNLAAASGRLAAEKGETFQSYVVAIGLAHDTGSWQSMPEDDKDAARDLFRTAHMVALQRKGEQS